MDKETANYVLDAVKGLVFKDKKVVNYKMVSILLNGKDINIQTTMNRAKQYLFKFSEENNNLKVVFFVSGCSGGNNQKVFLIQKKHLNMVLAKLDSLSSLHVYSVQENISVVEDTEVIEPSSSRSSPILLEKRNEQSKIKQFIMRSAKTNTTVEKQKTNLVIQRNSMLQTSMKRYCFTKTKKQIPKYWRELAENFDNAGEEDLGPFEPEDFLAKDTDFPGSSQDELYLYNAEDFEMSLEDDQILYNLVEVIEKTLQRAEDFPGDEQDEQYLYEEVCKEDDAWTLCCLNHGLLLNGTLLLEESDKKSDKVEKKVQKSIFELNANLLTLGCDYSFKVDDLIGNRIDFSSEDFIPIYPLDSKLHSASVASGDKSTPNKDPNDDNKDCVVMQIKDDGCLNLDGWKTDSKEGKQRKMHQLAKNVISRMKEAIKEDILRQLVEPHL